METIAKISKVIIFDNKNSENYWLEEPMREEYYRSEVELNHYLKQEALENVFNNDETIDEFVYDYLKRNGETPRDFTIFVKELRTFLEARKKKQTKDNRIG